MDKIIQQDQEQDLQLVELGDAKEVTMGTPEIYLPEDNPTLPYWTRT